MSKEHMLCEKFIKKHPFCKFSSVAWIAEITGDFIFIYAHV